MSICNFLMREVSPKKKIQSYTKESSEITTKGRQNVQISKRTKEWTETIKSEKEFPQLLTIKRKRYEEIHVNTNSKSSNDLVMNLLKKCYHCLSVDLNEKPIECFHDGLIEFSCIECYNIYHGAVSDNDNTAFEIIKNHQLLRSERNNGYIPIKTIGGVLHQSNVYSNNNKRDNYDEDEANVSPLLNVTKLKEKKAASAVNFRGVNLTFNNPPRDQPNIISIPLISNNNRNQIASDCENYYFNKSHSKALYKKKCLYCQESLFHVNELLYFDTINCLFGYLMYLFTFQMNIVNYNTKIVQQNKTQIKQCYDDPLFLNQQPGFLEPKTLCKGCLLLIINQRNCIEITKKLLKGTNKDLTDDKEAYNNHHHPHPELNLKSQMNNLQYLQRNEPKTSENRGTKTIAKTMMKPLSILPSSMTEKKNAEKDMEIHLKPTKQASINKEKHSSSSPALKTFYVPQSLFTKLAELNAELTNSVEKVTQGAMLFNDHYQISSVGKEDFDQYCRKIRQLHQTNKDIIVNLIQTALEYKTNLFSLLDFIYQLYSMFSERQRDLSNAIKHIIVRIEDEFNEYNTLISHYSQALIAFQNLTADYLEKLKEQRTIFNIV